MDAVDEVFRRAQMLQHENDELRAEMAAKNEELDLQKLQIAEFEKVRQDLSERLAVAEQDRQWCRKEFERLSAQMEVVDLIFGGSCTRRDRRGCY